MHGANESTYGNTFEFPQTCLELVLTCDVFYTRNEVFKIEARLP